MNPDAPLILASGSPRRRDLLTRAGVSFEIRAVDIDETARPDESPTALAERLAQEKALAAASRVGAPPRRLVLGADTVVALGDDALGKPRDPEHAVELLTRLVGGQHHVVTGVAVVDSESGSVRSRTVTSRVSMREASAEEIRDYVALGECLDKAGAYALQGEGRRFVVHVEGSETNVIGLPVEETLALLAEAEAP